MRGKRAIMAIRCVGIRNGRYLLEELLPGVSLNFTGPDKDKFVQVKVPKRPTKIVNLGLTVDGVSEFFGRLDEHNHEFGKFLLASLDNEQDRCLYEGLTGPNSQPDSKQLRFLRDRIVEVAKVQPEIKQLEAILLKIGGEAVVAMPLPNIDPGVPLLIAYGYLMGGPVSLKVMEPNQCFQNIDDVFAARAFGIIFPVNGYALGDDGLWRFHAWGMLRNGVLETTAPFLKYFGCPWPPWTTRNWETRHKALATGWINEQAAIRVAAQAAVRRTIRRNQKQ